MLINKQRKAETMVTPTPLRLVAIEESLQAEDDGRADPITERICRDRGSPRQGRRERQPRRDDDRARRDHAKSTRPCKCRRAGRLPDNPRRFPGWQTLLPSLRSASCSGWLSLRWRRSEGAHPLRHRPALPYTGSQRRGAVATPAIIGSARTGCRFTCSGARCPRYHPHRSRGEPRAAELSLDGNVLAAID